MIATLPKAVRSQIDDPQTFSRLVGFTRNYYTHWSASLEKKAAKGEELLRLTHALAAIVEALLLMELGYTEEQVEQLLNRNPRLASERNFAFGTIAGEVDTESDF